MAKKALRSPLLIVKVDVSQTGFDPDAVDARIYCINTVEIPLLVCVESSSFITIDEVTGAAARDNSGIPEFMLEAHAIRLIAEIKGWEWDGFVGAEIKYRYTGQESLSCLSYNFKSGGEDYRIDALRMMGRIIRPSH